METVGGRAHEATPLDGRRVVICAAPPACTISLACGVRIPTEVPELTAGVADGGASRASVLQSRFHWRGKLRWQAEEEFANRLRHGATPSWEQLPVEPNQWRADIDDACGAAGLWAATLCTHGAAVEAAGGLMLFEISDSVGASVYGGALAGATFANERGAIAFVTTNRAAHLATEALVGRVRDKFPEAVPPAAAASLRILGDKCHVLAANLDRVRSWVRNKRAVIVVARISLPAATGALQGDDVVIKELLEPCCAVIQAIRETAQAAGKLFFGVFDWDKQDGVCWESRQQRQPPRTSWATQGRLSRRIQRAMGHTTECHTSGGAGQLIRVVATSGFEFPLSPAMPLSAWVSLLGGDRPPAIGLKRQRGGSAALHAIVRSEHRYGLYGAGAWAPFGLTAPAGVA